MSRGRKKYTLDEQYALVAKQIEETERTLKDLKKKKRDLEAQRKEQNLSELRELIEKTGMSIEDVKDMIQGRERIQQKTV